MQPITIQAEHGTLTRGELNNRLVAGQSSLADDMMFLRGGSEYYLPRHQLAGRQSGYLPSLAADGKLSIYLHTGAPAGLAARPHAPSPIAAGVEVSLVYPCAGGKGVLPLALANRDAGIDEAGARLEPALLQALRAILFDSAPNASLVVRRRLGFAVQLSDAFILDWWREPAIRAALLWQLHMQFDSAADYLQMIKEAVPGFSERFMLLECCYEERLDLPTLPGFNVKRLTWKNTIYNYYQDNQSLGRVYFLPDGFQLAVDSAGAPSASLLRLQTPDGSLKLMKAIFRFFAEPLVDQGRIDAARAALRQELKLEPEMLSLANAKGVKSGMTLVIPTASADSSHAHEVSNSSLNLATGIVCELNLSFTAFQAVWEAIFSQADEQSILTGWVDVSLQEGSLNDRILLELRLGSTAKGDYFRNIFDAESNDTYQRKLAVHVSQAIFNQKAGDAAVLGVSLDFGPGAMIEFTAVDAGRSPDALLSKEVSVQSPVSDIILRQADPADFPYHIKVTRAEAESCATRVARSGSLYVLPRLVDEVNQACK
jgi:hypothetical protein